MASAAVGMRSDFSEHGIRRWCEFRDEQELKAASEELWKLNGELNEEIDETAIEVTKFLRTTVGELKTRLRMAGPTFPRRRVSAMLMPSHPDESGNSGAPFCQTTQQSISTTRGSKIRNVPGTRWTRTGQCFVLHWQLSSENTRYLNAAS